MKGQTCENTAGTVEGFCTPWKSVCCTGLIFCRNKKSPQTSIGRFAFMRQLDFCFAFDLLLPLVPVSGKTAARPLLSQTAPKVTFLLAFFLPCFYQFKSDGKKNSTLLHCEKLVFSPITNTLLISVWRIVVERGECLYLNFVSL